MPGGPVASDSDLFIVHPHSFQSHAQVGNTVVLGCQPLSPTTPEAPVASYTHTLLWEHCYLNFYLPYKSYQKLSFPRSYLVIELNLSITLYTELNEIHNLAFRITKETKLSIFQFKVMYNIQLLHRVLLHKMKIRLCFMFELW